MSEYTLTNDHYALMPSSRGITLNTKQSFVPYDINVVPHYEFEISEEINKVTYTGHALSGFLVSNGAELNYIENNGHITRLVNFADINIFENEGYIDQLENTNEIIDLVNDGMIETLTQTEAGGYLKTITDIPPKRNTTIEKVSGTIHIPVKSNLTGSIVFGEDDGSSAITLKYDSTNDCMVFTYE